MTLNQLGTILWGRKWLVFVALAVTVIATAVISFRMPKMYVATASLIISLEDIVPYEDLNAQVQLSNSYMATQVKVIQSRKVALKVVDDLGLADDPGFREMFIQVSEGKGMIKDWLADWLLGKLTVGASRASRIIDIYYSANDGAFAARVANAFAKAYIDTRLEMAVEPAEQTTAWLSEQLKPLRGKVEAARARLTAYQQEHAVVATNERLDIETARLQSLAEQLLAAQTATQDAEHRQRQIEDLQARGRSLETLPEIANNSFIQAIKAEMLKNENELLAELAYKSAEKYPRYQRTKAEAANLQDRLDREIALFTRGIDEKVELARQREQGLEDALAGQKEKVLELKQQHDSISVLAREVDSAQRAYDDAMTRFEHADIESRVIQTNALLFNRATAPVNPASPKVKQNLVIAAFAGTLLGLGLAFLFESFDRRVRSRKDLEREFRAPLLVALSKM
ncbi:MAG: chain length determinant protein EpsF [Gammaproteobacteria bacterium]|jgi:chain length determinant protein EpsF